MTAPRSGIAGIGVFSQIGHAPALYALMVAMLPVTVAGMLVSTARNAFAMTGFQGASGVGNAAVAAAIGGGVAGLFAGSLADRYSPRTVLVAVNLAFAMSTAALWLLVQQSSVTAGAFLALALLDGAMLAVSVSALAKLQAGLVSREAKGAAESVSSVRTSVGSLLGIAIGLRVGEGAGAIALAAALFVLVAVLVMLATRSVESRSSRRVERAGSARALVTALRDGRELRDVMIADSVMYLALPSSLLALGVVSEGVYRFNPALLAAGIVGVLIGRLLVAARGTLGPVPRDLTLATVLYALLALGGWLLIQEEWLLEQVAIMVALATVASACGSFVQTMLAAKLQERLPEDLRARGTGLIFAVRSVLLTIGVLVATQVVTGQSLHQYLVLIGVALLLATIGLRGFRRIR